MVGLSGCAEETRSMTFRHLYRPFACAMGIAFALPVHGRDAEIGSAGDTHRRQPTTLMAPFVSERGTTKPKGAALDSRRGTSERLESRSRQLDRQGVCSGC